MNSTIKLLDKFKETCAIASDNACAMALGVSRQAVSKWRNGSNHPDADSVEKMCHAINEPTSKWLHMIEAERARTPAAAKVWLRLAQGAGAVATLYLFSRLNVQTDDILALTPFIHYAKLTVVVVILAGAACAASTTRNVRERAVEGI